MGALRITDAHGSTLTSEIRGSQLCLPCWWFTREDNGSVLCAFFFNNYFVQRNSMTITSMTKAFRPNHE